MGIGGIVAAGLDGRVRVDVFVYMKEVRLWSQKSLSTIGPTSDYRYASLVDHVRNKRLLWLTDRIYTIDNGFHFGRIRDRYLRFFGLTGP